MALNALDFTFFDDKGQSRGYLSACGLDLQFQQRAVADVNLSTFEQIVVNLMVSMV